MLNIKVESCTVLGYTRLLLPEPCSKQKMFLQRLGQNSEGSSVGASSRVLYPRISVVTLLVVDNLSI